VIFNPLFTYAIEYGKGTDYMLVEIGIALFVGVSLVLFCCVRVAAKADREIERMRKELF